MSWACAMVIPPGRASSRPDVVCICRTNGIICSSASAGGVMTASTPSPRTLSSESVTTAATSIRASLTMSRPVISQSTQTMRSFVAGVALTGVTVRGPGRATGAARGIGRRGRRGDDPGDPRREEDDDGRAKGCGAGDRQRGAGPRGGQHGRDGRGQRQDTSRDQADAGRRCRAGRVGGYLRDGMATHQGRPVAAHTTAPSWPTRPRPPAGVVHSSRGAANRRSGADPPTMATVGAPWVHRPGEVAMPEMHIADVPAQLVAVVRRTMPMTELPSFYADALGAVAGAVERAGGSLEGAAFGWYHGTGPG